MSQPSAPSVMLLSLHDAHGLADLYHELERRGAALRGAPKPAYWQPGIWLFEAEDPDHNVLTFTGDETPQLLSSSSADAGRSRPL